MSSTLWGVTTDYPDWRIAAVGSEANLRIGYEYTRFITRTQEDHRVDHEKLGDGPSK